MTSEAYRAGMKAGAEWASRGRPLSLSHADPIGVVSWLLGQSVGHPEAITWLRHIGAPEGGETDFAKGLAEGNHAERQRMKRNG